MTSNHKNKLSGSERREPADRRHDDMGPPNGWRDRRRTVERRLPQVEEDAVPHSAWLSSFEMFKAFVSHRNTAAAAARAEEASADDKSSDPSSSLRLAKPATSSS